MASQGNKFCPNTFLQTKSLSVTSEMHERKLGFIQIQEDLERLYLNNAPGEVMTYHYHRDLPRTFEILTLFCSRTPVKFRFLTPWFRAENQLCWLSPRNFFQGEGQNLLLCKFLLLFYCFRTKFQGGAKVFKGGGGKLSQGGAPLPLWEKASMLSHFLRILLIITH